MKNRTRLKHLLWDIRDCLSDGTLDFTGDVKIPHSTTCDIATNVENPNVFSYNRSADPEAHKLFAEMTAKTQSDACAYHFVPQSVDP